MNRFLILFIISVLIIFHKFAPYDYSEDKVYDSCLQESVNKKYHFWPFANYSDYLRNYVWSSLDRVSHFLYVLIFFISEKEYKNQALLFLLMQSIFLVDFFLTYNSSFLTLSIYSKHIGIGFAHFFAIFKGLIVANVIYLDYARKHN